VCVFVCVREKQLQQVASVVVTDHVQLVDDERAQLRAKVWKSPIFL
jgi:hypothetical protein